MASSNIKLFDENKGNMLSDSEFGISNQRLNGLQTGIASSQLQNKAMYQTSLIAYAIAQVMMQNGMNANDTDAVSTFVNNLSGTMLQKVYDIATTAEAQAGVATGKWMSPALVKAAIDTLAAKAQNILSNETKTLLGLGAGAVPDNAFSTLKGLCDVVKNSAVQLSSGTYVGTGTHGASNPTSLTFGFIPKMLIVVADGTDNSPVFVYVGQPGMTDSRYGGLLFTLNDKTLSWYSASQLSGEVVQANERDTTYYYIAIGFLEGAA